MEHGGARYVMRSHRDTAAEWVSRLVKIPSVNPLHAGPRAGVPGELALAHAVADMFRELEASSVELDTSNGTDRPNVYAVFDGQSDRWVGLDVHLDTVGVEHMTGDPFDGRIENGRVWGRGSVDTKASLGVMMYVLQRMGTDSSRPIPNLLISGTVAEEAGGLIGALAFRAWLARRELTLDELVIAEPTMCAPVYGHKGGLGIEFTVRGTAAHSAMPHIARNAIDAAAELILALRDEHDRLSSVTPSTALGHGTLATTVVSGGSVRNIISDSCSVYVSRRLVPGEEPREVYDHLVEVATRSCPLPVESEYVPGMRAFCGSPDGSMVRRIASWSGEQATVTGLGTNAFRYDEAVAKEMVVFGPGSIDQAHAAEEWCDLGQLATAVAVFEQWLAST